MASTQILASSTSQLVVTGDATTAGHTLTIVNLRLFPRLGPAQIVRVYGTVDQAGTPINIEVDVTFYDAAFEEFGMYGEMKKKKSDGEKR